MLYGHSCALPKIAVGAGRGLLRRSWHPVSTGMRRYRSLDSTAVYAKVALAGLTSACLVLSASAILGRANSSHR